MYKFLVRNNIKKLFPKNFQISCISTTCSASKSSNIDEILNKNLTFIERKEKLYGCDEVSKTNDSIAKQLVNKAPLGMQPYLKIMRIDKPIGSWLLFWPGSWGIAFAAAPGMFPDPYLLTLFGAGAFIMRGAGCTINDMWDRDIDCKVERTMDRPLVNGTMNMRQAFIFLAGQLSLGLFILLQLNPYTIMLGVSSLGLVVSYPLMKRITYWPQFVLGLTFNWGFLMGYSAIHGTLDPICAPMYIAAICWTIVYDTIYAHQDIKDDIRLGVKSTAIRFMDNTKYWLTAFSTISVTGFTYSGILTEQTWPYYTAVALAASHLVWQIYGVNIYNTKDCANKFVSNNLIGIILFVGIVLGNYLKNKQQKDKSQQYLNIPQERIA